MPVTCPTCAVANPDGSRFCNGCGTRLPEATALAEERKTVTALFCDLIGFTATSEAADPEDVDRMLTRYFAMARSQVEAYGGVVEKFIGDAVVGVFGVPAAHEDDPERAVRAGLRIAEEAARLPALGGAPLRLRIGINTGEALVRLGVKPGTGERFLAGDTINTASRIQSVAPEMGVGVGAVTYEATQDRFEYEELPPASLKGKAEPVRIFRPRAPRARLGIDLVAREGSPFVGRAAELRMLTTLFEAVIEQRSARFAVVSGEPGLGKSRLVAELLAFVDAQPVLVTWQQGRCLPYGTGISFWALGEIVKAHAGILESDPASVAAEKLDGILPAGDERAWFRERLLPLIGIESSAAAGRDEQFTAWRRFLELLAERRPTVLVFEDLHWADDAMLMFLEDLAGRGGRVPMLAVGTTRPELFERRPGFLASAADTTRIHLAPLTTEDAGRLAERLLDAASLAPDLRAPILERAAGNPLFVEEFVRLLRDHGLLVEAADGSLALSKGGTLPVPDSISALIAARLDALPAVWKSVLADAAVVGKVFWSGALTAMGPRDPASVEAALDGLAVRQFVRPVARSSMAGEQELAFWHVLARDVAYAALPRAARATRHVAAARWIEGKASDRVEDVSDVLAHHYATALDLAGVTGDEAAAADLRGPASRFLLMAGERALELDVPNAVSLLERALALAPPGHPDRPMVLRRYAVAMNYSGRIKDAVAAFEEALASYRASGDTVSAAMVLGGLSANLRELGDSRGWTFPREAVDLLEPLGPSSQLADALVRLAFMQSVGGHIEDSLVTFERAMAVIDVAAFPRQADAVGLRGMVTGLHGLTRTAMGDEDGFAEIREGISLLTMAGRADRASQMHGNLSNQIGSWEGPGAAVEVLNEGTAFAASRGLQGNILYFEEQRVVLNYDLGKHDELLARLPELDATFESNGSILSQIELQAHGIRVATLRGEPVDRALLSWLEKAVRDSGDPENMIGLAAAAPARLLLGDREAARGLLVEVSPSAASRVGWWWLPRNLPMLVRTALELEDVPLAESIVEGFDTRMPYAEHASVAANAALLEARGELDAAIDAYADAADRWEQFGVIPERAFALIGEGRCLLATGRPTEATPILHAAKSLFEPLRARPALEQISNLLSVMPTTTQII